MSNEPLEKNQNDADKHNLKDCEQMEPIAIVGMAVRLPGGIDNPSDLWKFLVDKRDARGPIPQSRYNGDAFFDSGRKPGTSMVNAGYFLDSDLELFDTAAFPLSIPEIEALDPVQRQLLEVVRECLESAGEVGQAGKDVGCFVGTFGEDWQDLQRKDIQDYGAHRMTGSSDFAASNRISYVYDFRGPSVTTRTACSASLIALHSACQALYQNDCSSAIVASANIIMSPTNTCGLGDVGALSPDVSCKTFDAKANGYARAEGVAALYVKKLSHAIACKDPIRAVIRSTASNSDGKSSSFSNPNPVAHEALIRTAYLKAGLLPEHTGFVELHGTGTAIGDPFEAAAVGNVFGTNGTYIGSIKPNVGHAEGASGIISVIKGVLALENLTIPPNIKFITPNPKIPFQEASLMVPREPSPWPSNKKERVSINSFGLGGSNAHVILDSARSLGVKGTTPIPPIGDVPQLLVLSADHPSSIEGAIHSCSTYLDRHKSRTGDVLYTLNTRREHRQHRSFSLLRGTQLSTLKPVVASKSSEVVFVFTGQGAQYVGMAKELAAHSDQFAGDLQKLDDALSIIPHPPSWSIKDIIMHPPEDLDLRGVFSQPLCTAIQIALVNQLRAWGVQPAVVVGHSSGEIAAAYAAGAISMSDAMALSYHRGQSLPASSRKGGMAAVGMGKADVESFLRPGVTIGCENSPSNVTLSGDADVLQQVVTAIQMSNPTTFVRVLNVDMAYHSYHMKDVSGNYSKALEGLSFGSAKVPYFSTTYGRRLNTSDILDIHYWKTNLESPVLFSTAIKGILKGEEKQAIFLEVGPHSALQGPLRQCFQSSSPALPPVYIPTLVRGQDSYAALLTAMGMLHCAGASIDLKALSPAGRVLHDLSPYPFHRERIWKESRISRSWRFRKQSPHDILGVPILENNNIEPTWRNVLRPTDVSWICDHQIGPDMIFPAAAYIAMASEAFRQTTGSRAYTAQRVSFLTAMVLHEGRATEIITSLRPHRWTESQTSRGYEFTISSLAHDTWVTHCRGRIMHTEEKMVTGVDFESFPRHVGSQRWYDVLRRCGYNYGPAFARLTNITCSVDEGRASAVASLDRSLSESCYSIHPTMIDEAFQLLFVADARGRPRAISGTYMPTYVEELCVKPAASALSIQVDVDPSEGIRGSISGWSDGQVVLSGHGVHMSKLEDLPIDTGKEAQSGARLCWLPLLRFMKPSSLFKADGDAQTLSYKAFLRHFTHEFPQCNVLEILDETSSATQSIIENLYSESGERMFAAYTLASTEGEILSAAKARFGQISAVKIATFDIREDAFEQELFPDSYDLIIAHNSIEPPQSGQARLKNLRKLLKPCGYLLANEDLVVTDMDQSVMRTTHDLRRTATDALAGPERWDYALRQAGLSGEVFCDTSHVFPNHSVILAQAGIKTDCNPARVTLLVRSETSSTVSEVIGILSKNGITTKLCTLDDIPPTASIIVSLLEVDEPFLYDINQQAFKKLITFISALPSQQQLIWLTHSADARYSLVHGLARNLRLELGLDFATLKFDTLNNSVLDVLAPFVRRYRHNEAGSVARDYDYALVDGVIHVGRFTWYSIAAALSRPAHPTTGARLTVGKKGLLQSLAWTPDVPEQKPSDSMVQIEIAAVGMNFKDVLVAMGVVSSSTLGIEASGTVTQVGKGVTDLHPGDRVAVATNGCFATRIIVPRLNCVSIPDGVSFDDAATTYGVYCTSLLSLTRIARISAESSILIHSACGGIGLSAIQLCRAAGAKIYVTVGNDRKRKHLQDEWGIPAEDIFNSRDKTFRQELMARTKNRGVDVVLNSLSGELLHTSWECVADFGMMIELGRRDIQENGRLDMRNFSNNRGYHAVDYAQILCEKPELNQSLMQEVSNLLREGKISPVRPLTAFKAEAIEECFRFFQKGDHMGKVVVHMPSSARDLGITNSLRQNTEFDPDAAYLLVGGLGGLGRAVSVWMAERGARHLVYLSRSPLSSAKLDTLRELSAMGCTHQVFHGSVASAADVERAVRGSIKPIRGVFQMVAALKDMNISHMTYADWKSGVEAKVAGTLNIHHSVMALPLDFFVMFSSHVGLHGWYGQASYAAGNSYQDDFVQFRHSQGLAASVLDLGPIEDIGMLFENPELARRMRSTWPRFLSEIELFEALELAIVRSRPGTMDSQIISRLRPSIASMDANSNLPWANDARFLVYRNLEEDTCGNTTPSPLSNLLSEFLTSCSRDPSILTTETAFTTLSRELLLRICSFLAVGEEEQEALLKANFSELTLLNLGVDSMVAIEIRAWWRQRLGVEVSVLQILDCGNVKGLGVLAVHSLKERFDI